MIPNLDYWQKKFYLHFLIFKKQFNSLPLGRRLAAITYLFIFLSYPGQNHWQSLTYTPGPIQVNTAPYQKHLLPLSDQTPPPDLTAQSIYVFDPVSGTVIFEKNSSLPLYPASTTKIMTALVALDHFGPDQVFAIKDQHAIGSTLKLQPGEQFTVKNLLSAALIASANDAALALAENYPDGGYPGFVDQMNQKAKNLHLRNTTYSNVSGIESEDHKSTAKDLTLLAKEAIQQPEFLSFVSTPSQTITDLSGQHQYQLETTNELLGKVPGLLGVKTGWTQNAGECLVTYVERDGHKIITVVLNSTARFDESQALIEWAYTHHTWQEI